jgi:hypothetical protein
MSIDTGESHPYIATPANETLAQFLRTAGGWRIK